MKCRKSVAALTAAERAAYVQAVLDLKDPTKSPSRIPAAQIAVTNGGGQPNRYDDFVYLHNVIGFGAHRGSAFGPWHREFLRQFEHDLQQVSGNPELTIPYWDWTTDRAPTDPGFPFTTDFMGGFGNSLTGVVSTGPFADPTTWRINIRRSTDSTVSLKRSRGLPAGSDLPTRDDVLLALGVTPFPDGRWPSAYDAAPFNGDLPQTNPEFANQVLASFRKYLEVLLHDGIHNWVGEVWQVSPTARDGGQMSFPAVSVNDPVFFLHHANVDRLWAIWQRKTPTPAYAPVTGANVGHNALDTMIQFADQSAFTLPLLPHPADHQDHQAAGPWYDSDPPHVALATAALGFGDVVEQLTVSASVQFTVSTCQSVTLTATNLTGTHFTLPQGPVVIAAHQPGADVQTVDVEVAFQATGPLGIAEQGSLTIDISYTDHDGYDASAPSSTLLLGSVTIALSATPVEQPVEQPVGAVQHLATGHAQHGGTRGMGGHEHDHGHENMAFEMLRLDKEGNVEQVDIARDVSGYDEHGNDPGAKPTTPAHDRVDKQTDVHS
jgi:Common central domain of tyrosinase